MRFPIRMRYGREYRDNVDELKGLIIPVGNSGRVSSVRDMYSSGGEGSYQSSSLGGGNSMGGSGGGSGSSGMGGSGGGGMSGSGAAVGSGSGMSGGSNGGGMGGSTSGGGSGMGVSGGSMGGGSGSGGSSMGGGSGVGGGGVSEGSGGSSLTQTNSYGKTYLPLSELADINIVTGPPMISSENGMLMSLVFMNARGRDMGGVMSDSKEMIERNFKLPTGYSYSWSGQYEGKIRAQRTITIIMPVVFIIIFLLLFFTFKDAKEAGVVMLSVPFALIGGMYMTFFMGYNFSVAVWVGFIALYGIAVETGVVMVIYLHEALDHRIRDHQSGKRGTITKTDIYEATVEGSVLRLRPKLMTVFTAMIGLVPIMWSTGTGSDVMKPLTAPMIGGLLTSAVHVLVVTPILFAYMKERALSKGKLEISKMAGFMKET
jgi:Cu/Ag efflux pump CusA